MVTIRIICTTALFFTYVCCSSEYGRFSICFQEAIAETEQDGSSCDNWSYCDPYIKVLIDTQEVFRSKVLVDTSQPQWNLNEIYSTPKIRKNAQITIEMWDEDDISPDDLMVRWGPFTPKEISQMYYLNNLYNPNSLYFGAIFSEDL